MRSSKLLLLLEARLASSTRPINSRWTHLLRGLEDWYKQWKMHRVVWKMLPSGGPEGNQTVLRGAAPKDSLTT